MFDIGDVVIIRRDLDDFLLDHKPLRDRIDDEIGIASDMTSENYPMRLVVSRKFCDGETYECGEKMYKYKLKEEETGEEISWVWPKEFLVPPDDGFWLVGEFDSEPRENMTLEELLGPLSEFDGEPPF